MPPFSMLTSEPEPAYMRAQRYTRYRQRRARYRRVHHSSLNGAVVQRELRTNAVRNINSASFEAFLSGRGRRFVVCD